jgi:hypothetical protein
MVFFDEGSQVIESAFLISLLEYDNYPELVVLGGDQQDLGLAINLYASTLRQDNLQRRLLSVLTWLATAAVRQARWEQLLSPTYA